MNFGLSEKSYNLILKTLQNFSEIEKAIIFGSRAMGNYKKGSDIDLAIKGKNVNFDTVLKLHSLLDQELPLPYFFDIVDYNDLENKNLKEHIEKFGIVFFERKEKSITP